MGKPKTAADISSVLAQRAKERRDDPRVVWGIPWGFPGLDKLTGGIHEGELTILSARPSVGKTTLMVQIADSVLSYLESDEGQQKYPGQVIKLVLCESTAEVFQHRWACLRADVSARRIREGKASDKQYQAYLTELRELARKPVQYLDSGQTLEEIKKFLTTGSRAIWWALDYIQKCPLAPGRPNDGGVQAITLLSGTFTEIARSTAPGLALAHTTREVDKRDDRRPRMGDIKGGSALEGDARVVLGLYREDIYLKVPDGEVNAPRGAELLLLKQNEGESNRTVELQFIPKRSLFKDVSAIFQEEED